MLLAAVAAVVLWLGWRVWRVRRERFAERPPVPCVFCGRPATPCAACTRALRASIVRGARAVPYPESLPVGGEYANGAAHAHDDAQ
jgi:hypothetical protein